MRLEATSPNVEVFLFTNAQGTGYSEGDPINFNDPQGLFACSVGTGEGLEIVNCDIYAFLRVQPLDPLSDAKEQAKARKQMHQDLNDILHAQTAYVLANLSDDCASALTGAGVHLDNVARTASSTNYYSDLFEGNYPVSSISGAPTNLLLAGYLGDSRAATLPGPNGVTPTNNVVLGYKFFYNGNYGLNVATSQNYTLLHEALHTGTQQGDTDLYASLTGIRVDDPGGASQGVTKWLVDNNCLPVAQ